MRSGAVRQRISGGARLAVWLAVILLAGRFSASATGSDLLLRKLIEKGILTREEADEIQAETAAEVAEAIRAQTPTKLAAWIDEFTWNGDLRLRFDQIDYEESLHQPDQVRFAFRLRFGLEVEFQEWASIGFRLISGNGSPVGGNQVFGDSFSKKPVNIDLAYVRIEPPDWSWLDVVAGKMPNPVWRPPVNSPLVYDNDVTPEGIAEQLSWPIGVASRARLFANLGQYVIDELNTESDDPWMFDCQVGIEARFGPDPGRPKVRVVLAGGYLQTVNLAAPSGYQVGESPNHGNAVSVSGTRTNYLADFRVIRVSTECVVLLSDRPFLGTPAQVVISGEFLENLAGAYDDLAGATTNISPGQTTGWSVQVAFGDQRAKGQWLIAYQYKHLEADSTWDAITDSDYGLGGTDRQGHTIKLAYQLMDWWQLACKVGLTEKISRRPNSGHNTVGQRGEDLLRLQVDSLFRF